MRVGKRLPPEGWGLLGFAVGLISYSLTIVLTTPNLTPLISLEISLRLNPQIMLGMPLGLGIQAYLSSYVKRLPCPTGTARTTLGGTATGSALSAFFSFFSLTQVGCCTLWLFYLSLLPSVIGVAAAGFLIRYSPLLTNASLALVAIPILFNLWLIRARRLMT